MSTAAPLRQVALKGGVYLVGRQVVSILLKLIGVMLITRVLGPASYGAYVSAFNVYQYALLLGQAGVGVYLLRHQGDVAESSYRTAYTILVGMAVILTFGVEAGTGALSSWIGVEGFDDVMQVMIFALPFQLLAVPASVRLERRFDYKNVAMLEILGQLAYYALAIPLVMMHFGPVALGVAWLVQQVVTCIVAHWVARVVPRFAFDPAVARQIIRYASTFSVANWIWQLRMLMNPLIVGPVLGATAVGIIGMTIGLLEMLSIIKTIVWRLSVAVLGTVQSDAAKLRKAVTEGMELQTLAVGAILLGFGWTGQFIVPVLFGERWAAVMDIYPYIALSYFTIAPFNMHSATMSVINRNHELAVYHAVHILIFATVAYLAVPAFGIYGYGYAEMATIPAYILMHLFLARAIGSPDYRLTAVWWAAVSIGLFWKELGLWAIAVPFAALLLPASIRRLRHYLTIMRAKVA